MIKIEQNSEQFWTDKRSP